MLASPLRSRYRLFHFESGSRGKESPARNEPALSKFVRLLSGPIALVGTILRVRPDIVHLNSVLDRKAFWRDAGFLLVSRLLRRKVVLQFHGGSLATFCVTGVMRGIVKFIFSRSDALVVLASGAKSELGALKLSKSIAVIPNGVDIRQFRMDGTRVHSGNVRRLAYLGRLVRDKGIYEAVDAMAMLRSAGNAGDLEFVIAGSGPERDAIESHLAAAGLEGCVRLIGSVHGDEKIRFLQQADIFVLPSYHEGLPYALLESLAAGTPVIASRVGGIPDVVVDGVHGLLIAPKDTRAIADAVTRLRGSPETVRSMSGHCLERARNTLSLEHLADEFESLYDRVLLQTAGSPGSAIPKGDR
jgi:glycosyltransferase involved in cell wall biosynthesis